MGLGNYVRTIHAVLQSTEDLNIPWGDLKLRPEEAIAADLPVLAQKLALLAYYSTDVSQRLRHLDVVLTVSNAAFDAEVQLQLAANEGSKASVTVQTAVIIASSLPLQRLQEEMAAVEAERKAVAGMRDALDLLWRTTSRIIATRQVEAD